jgi:hypothetical protein
MSNVKRKGIEWEGMELNNFCEAWKSGANLFLP